MAVHTAQNSHAETDLSSCDTRSKIVESLLANGTSTAAQLAQHLKLTSAGVRRHLDELMKAGQIVEADAKPATAKRGRPARAFQLTAAGRQQFGHSYDALALDALRALKSVAGSDAVREVARQRVSSIMAEVVPAADTRQVPDVAESIADAFTDAGYEASVEYTAGNIQICNHHCPISSVVEEFPELCAAEQDIVSQLVGSHVQLLSRIPSGNCACTTNVPYPSAQQDPGSDRAVTGDLAGTHLLTREDHRHE